MSLFLCVSFLNGMKNWEILNVLWDMLYLTTENINLYCEIKNVKRHMPWRLAATTKELVTWHCLATRTMGSHGHHSWSGHMTPHCFMGSPLWIWSHDSPLFLGTGQILRTWRAEVYSVAMLVTSHNKGTGHTLPGNHSEQWANDCSQTRQLSVLKLSTHEFSPRSILSGVIKIMLNQQLGFSGVC